MSANELIDQLRQNTLFQDVAVEDLTALLEHMQRQFHPVGKALFQQGDVGTTMYIIRNGQVRIFTYHRETTHEVTLMLYGQDEIFGELSLIDSQPRSASAVVTDALEVLALERDDFLSFLNERPKVGLAMMRSLAQRLRRTTNLLEDLRVEAPQPEPTGLQRMPAQQAIADVLDKVEDKPKPEKIDRDNLMAAMKQLDAQQKTTAEPEAKRRVAGDKTGVNNIFDRIAAELDEEEEKKMNDE